MNTRYDTADSRPFERAAAAIFIHSTQRASSTWFWSKFRELAAAQCFFEPFNFLHEWLTPDRASRLGGDSWESRHPPTAPYYLEYSPLIRAEGGVELFDPAMTMQWFIPQGGLRGELRPREQQYLARLIRLAGGAGKVAVCGEVWSLGRAWAIKTALGGFHILQTRSLWQQWLSYLSYKRKGSRTFYCAVLDTIFRDDDSYFKYLVERGLERAADPRTGEDPSASPLMWKRGYRNLPRDEATVRRLELLPEPYTFALFLGMRVYLYLHAQLFVDLAADVTLMARDESYRRDIEAVIADRTGLPVSFADAADVEPQNPVGFDRAAVDWGEVRGYIAVAVENLSAVGDPSVLAARADALIAETIEEMQRNAQPGTVSQAGAWAVPDRRAAGSGDSAVSGRRPGDVKTIGLVMIVKNEAAVIRRCLASARPLIDYLLIVDTGSADGTQQLIRDYLREEDLPGTVIDEPWQDFAYNRSFALQELRKLSQIDYALMIDADDELELEDGFRPKAFKTSMHHDLYDVEVLHGDMSHQRPHLWRNDLPFSFKGVVHEYLEAPPGDLARTRAAGFRIRIKGGGARSQNSRKFEDDAALLERALSGETDPFLVSRYTFYLAQSYRDCGEKERALEHYLRRAELGYWIEEVYISLLEAGNLLAALQRPFDEVIAAYLRASDTVSARAEALYAASRFCREHSRNAEGCEYARRGIDLRQPEGALFAQPWVYDYGLLDEFAVNGYWAGAYRESLDASLRLLAGDKLPTEMRARVAANARAAASRLPDPPDLGSFGADNFLERHRLAAPRPLRSVAAGAPRVLLAILAKQKEWALPLYLECIEALDYPKSAIVLYIRTNNNTDRTEPILRDWVTRIGRHYAAVEFEAADVADRVEQFREHEWNATRFRVLGRIRAASLRRALELDCEYYFVADVDNFLRRATLRELVALNLPIVAPLLRTVLPEKLYSNFHAEIDAAGYYAKCDQYYWVLAQQVRGLIEVPVVHCSYLVRADVIPELAYEDGSSRHEYVVFSDSARKAGIPQYLDNRQVYGYVAFAAGELHVGDGIERARALLLDDLSGCRREAAAAAPAPTEDEARFFDYCRQSTVVSKSQNFQDLFVLYELEDRRGGFFVEFGAGDGTYLSNTHLLEFERGWNGILAEPARCHHEKLRAARNCIIDERCVWQVGGTAVSFVEAPEAELSTIEQFVECDGNAAHRMSGKRYEVGTISLTQLLDQYDAPRRIDFLSVDTEGSELEILQGFDFGKYEVQIIVVEHNYTARREPIHGLLTANGFRRKFERYSKQDDWYVNIR